EGGARGRLVSRSAVCVAYRGAGWFRPLCPARARTPDGGEGVARGVREQIEQMNVSPRPLPPLYTPERRARSVGGDAARSAAPPPIRARTSSPGKARTSLGGAARRPLYSTCARAPTSPQSGRRSAMPVVRCACPNCQMQLQLAQDLPVRVQCPGCGAQFL